MLRRDSAQRALAGGLVLAAGRSSRSGGAKALGELDGEALVARAVRTLGEAGCAPIVVVTAAPHAALVEAALAAREVTLARNPDPDRGMLSSVQVGLAALGASLPRAVALALVDHPRVTPGTVRALLAAVERGAASARPTFGGRGGHPVALSTGAALGLLAAAPRASLRDVLLAAGPREDVEVGDDAVLEDLDTPEALAAARVVLVRRADT